MTLITNDGLTIVTNTDARLAPAPRTFVDTFERGLTGTPVPLGDNWIDAHDVDDTAYEPCGVYHGSVVCADPRARVGADYAEDQLAYTSEPGEQVVGIAMAWRDFGSTRVYVELEWTGLSGLDSGVHSEGAVMVHIDLSNTKGGLGLWPVEIFLDPVTVPIYLLGYVGNPPELFTVIDNALMPGHVHGTPRTIGIHSTGTHITCWEHGPPGVGDQINFATNGLSPIPVHADLLGSTLHGFELDTHLTGPQIIDDVANPNPPFHPYGDVTHTPFVKVINSISMRYL